LNNGRRYSQFIKHSAARNLIAAAEYAASIDRPFTLAISINWTLGHIRRPLQKALQIFLERMGRWLRRRTSEPLYAVWAHENADANLNTHLLVWVPTHHQESCSQMIRSWLKATGAKPAKGLYRSKRIYNWRGQLAYILKGTEENACAPLGITHTPQGPITGQRCGTSRIIGAAARRKACSDRQLIATWLTKWVDRQESERSMASPTLQTGGPRLATIGYPIARKRRLARQRPVGKVNERPAPHIQRSAGRSNDIPTGIPLP